MSSFNIRKATVDDAVAIATIQFNGWQHTYKGILDDEFLANMNFETGCERWKKILAPGGTRAWNYVMENDEGNVVGWTSVADNPDTEMQCKGEMMSLYLLKEYHGKGLGKQLFFYAIESLRIIGIKSFYLYVLAKSPTVKFYRHFKPDLEKEVKGTIGDKEYDELVMAWHDTSKLKSKAL